MLAYDESIQTFGDPRCDFGEEIVADWFVRSQQDALLGIDCGRESCGIILSNGAYSCYDYKNREIHEEYILNEFRYTVQCKHAYLSCEEAQTSNKSSYA